MDLTDQQWTIIEPLFEEKRRSDGRGRPWRDACGNHRHSPPAQRRGSKKGIRTKRSAARAED
jgi:transposase